MMKSQMQDVDLQIDKRSWPTSAWKTSIYYAINKGERGHGSDVERDGVH